MQKTFWWLIINNMAMHKLLVSRTDIATNFDTDGNGDGNGDVE
jgi:hypothetical protein